MGWGCGMGWGCVTAYTCLSASAKSEVFSDKEAQSKWQQVIALYSE